MTAPTRTGWSAGTGSGLQLDDQRIDLSDTILDVTTPDLRPVAYGIHATRPLKGRRDSGVHVRQLPRSESPAPAGAMTVTSDAAAFTSGNSADSGPPRSGLTARHAGNTFAVSAALAVAAAVMLVIIVVAIITLANDGLHANWR
jgi:hypothetical protein